MNRFRPHRPSPAMIVALIALIVAMGGTGYAAIKLGRNSVGTKQIKKNAVTTSKVKNGSLRARDFPVGELPVGPQGAKGDPGANGADGAPATSLWAIVGADGTLNGGTATDASLAAGKYEVTFGRDVSKCAGVASVASSQGSGIGTVGNITLNVFVGFNRNGGAAQNVASVAAFQASNGNAVTASFELAVFC